MVSAVLHITYQVPASHAWQIVVSNLSQSNA